MNIVRWFKNLSFVAKMTAAYFVFSMIPMLLVTAYNYSKTREVLQEQSYIEMQQNIISTGNSMDSALQSCGTIMDLLYTNQMLNSYLSIDYTNLSYWEMFSYVDRQLHTVTVLNPDIYRISFYSTNDTLPEDDYYFYPVEELPVGFAAKADEMSGTTAAAGLVLKNDRNYIGLIRKLNYFSSGETRNYMMLLLDAESLNYQLRQENEAAQMFLLDEHGQVLSSTDTAMIGQNMVSILPEWKDIPQTGRGAEVTVGESDMVCMRREGSMGTHLVLLMDQASLLSEAGAVSGRILLITGLCFFFAFCAISLNGKLAQKRVDKVVYAARKLGEGEFDYILTDMGNDEIGQISEAFNSLNERIRILIRDNYEKRILIKSSEMNLLQEQINPHFLYNALSVISSMAIREGGRKTVESVRYLADFYRISLNKGRQIISVQEELSLLQNYMKIQKLRFGELVEISYEVDRRALPFRTIKLLLQPLVENAIHHGRREEETLHIGVAVRLKENRVLYEVTDDGLGIEPEKLINLRTELKQSQEGFGLKNVDIRVKLHYGEAYGVTVNSTLGLGTQVRVEIPQVAETP